MAPIVKISNLDKYFGRLQVLKNISLDIQPREVVCLIGRSGSGKSTLLRCINFLEEPSHGTIEVDGTMMTGRPGIFAGGDMVPGEQSVTVATGQGKKAARHIDAYLRGSAYVKPEAHEPATFSRLNT